MDKCITLYLDEDHELQAQHLHEIPSQIEPTTWLLCPRCGADYPQETYHLEPWNGACPACLEPLKDLHPELLTATPIE